MSSRLTSAPQPGGEQFTSRIGQLDAFARILLRHGKFRIYLIGNGLRIDIEALHNLIKERTLHIRNSQEDVFRSNEIVIPSARLFYCPLHHALSALAKS